jgi:hypothetical protein
MNSFSSGGSVADHLRRSPPVGASMTNDRRDRASQPPEMIAIIERNREERRRRYGATIKDALTALWGRLLAVHYLRSRSPTH